MTQPTCGLELNVREIERASAIMPKKVTLFWTCHKTKKIPKVTRIQNSVALSRKPSVDHIKWLGRKAYTKISVMARFSFNFFCIACNLSNDFKVNATINTRLMKPNPEETNLTASSSGSPKRTSMLAGKIMARTDKYNPSPNNGNSSAGLDSAVHLARAAYVPSSGAKKE